MAEGNRVAVEPDLNFIKFLKETGGDTLKKCYQCATCSVVCPLSEDKKPFPRKEMVLAQWGLKDKLMADPNVMLCHQCGDCTTNCPRGAKPGDVLGAIRAYAYTYYGFPQGLAKFASQGKNLPLLIAMPALLILVVWWLTGGMMRLPQDEFHFGYFFLEGYTPLGIADKSIANNVLVINSMFVPALGFAMYVLYRGVTKMWKNMSADLDRQVDFRPSVIEFIGEFLLPSLKEIIKHSRFKKCSSNASRLKGHLPLMLGFIGLFIMTIYAAIRKDVFGIHGAIPMDDPFKIMANISGISMIVGIGILWANRSKMEVTSNTVSTFYDWFLLGKLMAVGLTGMVAQFARLLEMPLFAYIVYYFHLVAVLMLFVYLPYTKLAHIVYRTAAITFERYRVSKFVRKLP